MNRIVAIVGMAGAGKTEVSNILRLHGLGYVRFGDITMEELDKRDLEVNEKNEKLVREALRREHGMSAYAKLNIPKLGAEMELRSVIADGLYSWEEYLVLKDNFAEKLVILAVYASQNTRAQRLAMRRVRPLSLEELKSRDKAEIENLNKGGPIAVADYTVINEMDLNTLRESVESIWRQLCKY